MLRDSVRNDGSKGEKQVDNTVRGPARYVIDLFHDTTESVISADTTGRPDQGRPDVQRKRHNGRRYVVLLQIKRMFC